MSIDWPSLPDLIPITQACTLIHADRRTLIKWAECGLLLAYRRPDNRIFIDRDSLRSCLDALHKPD